MSNSKNIIKTESTHIQKTDNKKEHWAEKYLLPAIVIILTLCFLIIVGLSK